MRKAVKAMIKEGSNQCPWPMDKSIKGRWQGKFTINKEKNPLLPCQSQDDFKYAHHNKYNHIDENQLNYGIVRSLKS